jgi:RHS repeat-associated protein
MNLALSFLPWPLKSTRDSRTQRRGFRFRRSSRRLFFEQLEDRCMPATVLWALDSDGDWNVGDNWSTGTVPTASDDVIIDRAAGAFTITHSSGTHTVKSIQNAEALVVSGGSLTGILANTGTAEARDVGVLNLSGSWANSGMLRASNGGDLNLGGTFSAAGLGTFDSNGGTIDITGTLDNSGATLVLTAASGSLRLAGGTIRGGTVTTSGGAMLIGSSGTLDGVTLGNLDLTAGSLVVVNGLTLDGTAILGDSSGSSSARLNFSGSQSLGGTGTVLFGGSSFNALRLTTADTTLTIGPGVTVRGRSGTIGFHSSWGGPANVSVVNQGTILADTAGGTISIVGQGWSNTGTLQARNGGDLNLGGTFTTAGLGTFDTQGTQVSASSSYSGQPPEAAFDGNLETPWGAGTYSGTITARFESPLTFDRVLLFAIAQPTTAETYTIYGSNDGVAFSQLAQSTQTVVQGSVNTLEPIICPTTTAQYLRIAVNGNASWVVIYEAQLMLGSTPVTIPAPPAGDINITGVLDNSGATLPLTAATRSLRLAGGTIRGGTVTTSGGAMLIGSSGTLDGVTLGNLDLTAGSLVVVNGLTLDGTAILGDSSGSSSARLNFSGSQSLGGTGTVLFGGSSFNALRLTTADTTLTIGPGVTVRGRSGTIGFHSSWGGPANVSVVNQGTILADTAGGTISIVGQGWSNTGTLQARNGGDLNLGGTFTTAGLGTFDSNGGAIRLTGTLDNTAATLAVGAATGSLTLAGGTIRGGTITGSGEARLLVSGGTLDGVTVASDVTVPNAASLTVTSGLTLDGTLTLSSTGSWTTVYFVGSQALSGTGHVVFGGTSWPNQIYARGVNSSTPATLTIGPGITVHGSQSGSILNYYAGDAVLSQASVEIQSTRSLDLNGDVRLDGLNRLASGLGSSLNISSSLLGDTRNADLYSPQGTLRLDGFGTEASPQLLEVMGHDLGTDAAGFRRNFAYGTLALSNNTYLRLVDQSNNSPGEEPEALYVNSLMVPAGTTLDLNGLQLYARATQINGAIAGGSVEQIPDGGPIEFGVPTPGSIRVTLDWPAGIAFGPDGNLYVAGHDSDNVVVYDGSTGQLIRAFVSANSGGLDRPPEILFGPDGNADGVPELFVSSYNTDTVMRYDGATGDPMPAPGKTGAVFASAGTTLDGPVGLAFRDGKLYVASEINSQILRFDATTGDFFDIFVSAGSGGLSGAHDLVFGPDDNLYVSSQFNHSVLSYDGATGAFIKAFVPTSSGGVNRPVGLAFGPDGNLYVSSRNGDSVLRYSGTTGTFIDTFVPAGVAGLDGPESLLFGPGNNLYVTSADNDKVLRYDGATGQPSDVGSFTRVETDEWTIFGRGGRSVTIVVNPGSGGSSPPVPPHLGYVEVKFLDSADNVLATPTNSGFGSVATAADVPLPADGTYRIEVRARPDQSTSTGNYTVTVWDVTADVAPLVFNQQYLGQIETPFSVDRWTFYALANQQVRFDLINASTSGIVFDLVGPDGWTGFRDLAGDSELVTLPASGAYVLTARGTAEQTGSYAFRLVETVQVDLALGTPFAGTSVGSGQAQLFRVTLPEASPLLVTLDDSSANNRNELYAKLGSPPTRGDYHYRFSTPASADQTILVPMATPGTWYILVYSEAVPSPGSFTLLAADSEIFLTSVTPDRHGNSAPATLTLSGAGFVAGTSVALVAADGTAYAADLVEVDSFAQLSARFGLLQIPAGTYAVRVTRPDGPFHELPAAFQVTQGGQARLETNLIVPQAVRPRGTATLYVEYANTGEVAMPAPLLLVAATDNALMTLDESRIIEGFWASARPEGFSDTVQFLAGGANPGILQPGERVRVPVHYIGLSTWDGSGTIDFTLSTLDSTSTALVDWNAIKDSLRPPSITPEAWDAVYANLVAQVGATWGNYVRMLDDNAAYLGRLGLRVLDVGQLLAFELQQANGLSPLRYLAAGVDAAVPAPGLSLGFARVFPQSITSRYELGPLGRGWSHSWETRLTVGSDGTVIITGMAGSQRVFQPDLRGGYFTQPGDHGTLTNLGGGIFSLREPDGTFTGFRADGLLDYIEETNGNRITAGYMAALLTSLTHSSGQSLTIAYNAAGLIESVTDDVGHQTLFTYDAAVEHLIAVQDFDGRITRYTYSAGAGAATEHALLSVEFPDGTHQFFSYDERGRLAAISRDGGAEQITFSYDMAGTVSATDAAGGTTKYFFDHRGLVVKIVDPVGRSAHLSFDNHFNLVQMTDPVGQMYQYEYDARDNLISSTDPLGHTTLFAYGGPFNRLTSVTDANGNSMRYGYDADGNLTTTSYGDGSVERLAYDTLGNPVTWTNRRGRPIDFTVDSAGRITSKTFADGSTVTYAYDTRGNLVSATDATGTTTLDYDANDRLVRITYPTSRFLEFTYDSAGRRTRMVDQDGFTVNYEYDAVGRLSRLSDGVGALVAQYTYDNAGRLARKDMGNGTYTTFEYDLAGQLLHLVNHAPDGSVNSRFDYTYDELGQRTSMATLDGQWTYGYDGTGQLVHAVFASNNPAVIPNQDLQYVYDPLGNRIRTIINGVTTEYVTNDLNQYTTVGTASYRYDLDGNLISKTDGLLTETYVYNDENRLVSVVTPAGTWTYEYDVFGNRVATVENGERTEYLLDPSGLVDVVAEYDGTGSLIAHYTHGLGLVSRTDAVGVPAYYDFDVIGSTAGISATDGAYLNHYSYLPFGEADLSSETLPNSYRFVGQIGVLAEPNRLAFMRRRLFDPENGRFVMPDPIGLAGQDSNLYRYSGNNPVSFTDPSGTSLLAEIRCFAAVHALALVSIRVSPLLGILIEIGGHLICFGLSADKAEASDFDPGGPPPQGQPQRIEPIPSFPPIELSDVNWPEGLAPDEPSAGPLPPIRPPNPPESTVVQEIGSGLVGAIDPNQKTGPAGFGDVSYIAASTVVTYRIDFENESSATAPAQRVVITDQLDSDLDWSTFELTEIGFGDQLITVTAGSQYYQTTVPMRYGGRDFVVQIEAGLNSQTGLLTVVFQSLDPNTSLPPDVLTGFLPPEDGTGRGMGHVSYAIRPRAGLVTGTEIRNVALITFDMGETIATNQIDPHDPSQGTVPAKEALNTIDAGLPISSVEPLPARTESTTFSVRWSGSDDPGGSGIASYDIFVSDSSGEYAPWLENTTLTQALFTGARGHTYAFYSVASDNVGHVEPAPSPSSPDARIRVLWPPGHMGVARPNVTGGLVFSLDSNGNLNFDPGIDAVFNFGLAFDRVVVGDWNGDEVSELGVARPNATGGLVFSLDSNGNLNFDPGVDQVFNFGLASDVIVAGDWDGDGDSELGVVRPNATGGLVFSLDSNGNLNFDPGIDAVFNFGLAFDRIVVGDWTGDGASKLGVARPNGAGGLVFSLDSNGNLNFDPGIDAVFNFGLAFDRVVVGDWTGDGASKLGVARPNPTGGLVFSLDSNGNLTFDPGTDEVFNFGLATDTIVVGAWPAALATPAAASTGSDLAPDLMPTDLARVIEAAISSWSAAGATGEQIAALWSLSIAVVELPDNLLALTLPGVIYLDADAAGHGWFVDPTPETSEEYTWLDDEGWLADVPGSAADHIDLLSVLAHEFGHVLGADDAVDADGPDHVMASRLPASVRRLPTAQAIDAILASELLDDLLAP